MAKTAKLKNSHKPSPHSRASKRAPSPLPKSLPTLPTQSRPSVLAAHTNAGVSKKKGGKILKRKQKLRVERGKERAEDRGGKMEVKRGRAGERRERGKGRSAKWEELNQRIGKEIGGPIMRGVEGGEKRGESEWVDEEGGMEGVDGDGDEDVMEERGAKGEEEVEGEGEPELEEIL